ncbi:PilZ domain-containing protein, partial [Myxococcota bacterium]
MGRQATDMESWKGKYADRRQAKRFAATHRVEYEVDGRRNISFLANLSLGGMFVRSAGSLKTGGTVDFHIILDDGKEPLDIKGLVLQDQTETNGAGARVQFPAGQEAAGARLIDYIEGYVVPFLEKACNRPRPSADKVMDLAVFYTELGRREDTHAVYKRGIEANPRNVELHERFATFLIVGICDTEEGDLLPLLTELDGVVESGLGLKQTDRLRQVADDAAEIRAGIEKAREEAERLQQERRFTEQVESRVAEAVEEREQTLRTEHEGVLSNLGAEHEAVLSNLGAEHESALGPLRDERDEARQALAGLQAQVQEERAGLEEERQQLADQQRQIEADRSSLQQERQSLVDEMARGRQELAAQMAEYDVRVNQLDRERSSFAEESNRRQAELNAASEELVKQEQQL